MSYNMNNDYPVMFDNGDLNMSRFDNMNYDRRQEMEMRNEFKRRQDFDRKYEMDRRSEYDRRNDFDNRFPFWWLLLPLLFR